MRRLTALLILLLHINTSLFIPVVDEVDMYDVSGRQVGDINSLVQLLGELITDCRFSPETDHDDDRAHFFNLTHHIHTYTFSRTTLTINDCIPRISGYGTLSRRYEPVNDRRVRKGVTEILVPPPEKENV
ncbi:hypothetical protein [Rurimicrobium arvi]|uniref:hypothetical protein n=1 Tax=Rurimicrobium arvi TaxID=2049916 RepID=UPI0031DA48BB